MGEFKGYIRYGEKEKHINKTISDLLGLEKGQTENYEKNYKKLSKLWTTIHDNGFDPRYIRSLYGSNKDLIKSGSELDEFISVMERSAGRGVDPWCVLESIPKLKHLVKEEGDIGEIGEELIGIGEDCIKKGIDPFNVMIGGIPSLKNIIKSKEDIRREFKGIIKVAQKGRKKGDIPFGILGGGSSIEKFINSLGKEELDELLRVQEKCVENRINTSGMGEYGFALVSDFIKGKENIKKFGENLIEVVRKGKKKGFSILNPGFKALGTEFKEDMEGTFGRVNKLLEKGLFPADELVRYLKHTEAQGINGIKELVKLQEQVKTDEKEGLKTPEGKAVLYSMVATKEKSKQKFLKLLDKIDPEKIPKVPEHHKEGEFEIREVRWSGLGKEALDKIVKGLKDSEDPGMVLLGILSRIKTKGKTGAETSARNKIWGVIKRTVLGEKPSQEFREEIAKLKREGREHEVLGYIEDKQKVLENIVELTLEPSVNQNCGKEMERALKAVTWIKHGERLKDRLDSEDIFDRYQAILEFYSENKNHLKNIAEEAVRNFNESRENGKKLGKVLNSLQINPGWEDEEKVSRVMDKLTPRKIKDEHKKLESNKPTMEVIGEKKLRIVPSSNVLDAFKYAISQDCSIDKALDHLYADYFTNHRVYDMNEEWLGNVYTVDKDGKLIIDTIQAHDRLKGHPGDYVNANVKHFKELEKKKVDGVYMPSFKPYISNKSTIQNAAAKRFKGEPVELKLPGVETQSVREGKGKYRKL